MHRKKIKIVISIAVLLIVLVILAFAIPVSSDLNFEIEMTKWNSGVEGQKGILSIDGIVSKSLLGNSMHFKGDVKTIGVQNPELRDVKMHLKLDKNNVTKQFVIRPGILHKAGDNLATNETVGLALIQGVFDKLVIFQASDVNNSEFQITAESFWTNLGFEDAKRLIQEWKD